MKNIVIPIEAMVEKLKTIKLLDGTDLAVIINHLDEGYDVLLNNIIQFGNLLQSNLYMSQTVQSLSLEFGKGNFDMTKISPIFGIMLEQIKHTSIKKLDIHKLAGIRFDEFNNLINILPETKITHLIIPCGLFDHVLAIKLFNILPYTQITHLNLSNNFLKQNSVMELLNILQKTKITHLNMGLNVFAYGANNSAPLFAKLAELLPQTKVVSLQVFNVKYLGHNLSTISFQETMLLQHLCAANRQEKFTKFKPTF